MAAMNDFAVTAKLYDLEGKRIFVAGHRGMVGSAIVRRLASVDCEVVTAGREKVDLLSQQATEHFLNDVRPHVIVVAAAKVGGIHANNTFPAEFIYENLADRHQFDQRRLPGRYRKAFVSGLVLHLPPACAAAHNRGGTSHWSPRTNERMVCDRKDRRHQALPSLPAPVWSRLYFRDANERLWAWR